MFRFINISKKMKREVEEITCENCGQAKLSFVSAEYDEDFIGVDGEELTVDTFCNACKVNSKVLLLYTA